MNLSTKSISVPCTLICAIGLSLLFTGCTATSIDGMRRPAVERIGGYPDRAANELNLPYRKRVDELFQNGGRLNSELNTRQMARDGGGMLESQSVQRNIDNLKEEQAFLKRKIADMNQKAEKANSSGRAEEQAISNANSALRRQLESQSLQIESLQEQIAMLQGSYGESYSYTPPQTYTPEQTYAPPAQPYTPPQTYSPPQTYTQPQQNYTQSQPYNPPVYEAPYQVPKPQTVYQSPAPRYTQPPVVEVPNIMYEDPSIVHAPPVFREPEPLYAPQVELPQTPRARVIQQEVARTPTTVVIPKDPVRPSRHKVRPGEYLSTIASRYSVSMPDILAANPEIDPNRLRVGQLIKIP